jgi:hypothetical protein
MAKDDKGLGMGEGRSRFPEGMTERKAKARATAKTAKPKENTQVMAGSAPAVSA